MISITYDNIDALYRYIDSVNYMEQITDDVLDTLYFKYGHVPKKKYLVNEIKLLKSQKELKKVDQMFLDLLTTALNWIFKVPMDDYLELWTYERNLPYKRVRIAYE